MCIHCRRQLLWWENIPILSYIYLKGRCRTCHKPYSSRYLYLEIGTALVLVFIYFYHTQFIAFNPVHFLRDVFFVSFLILIFTYDVLYKMILPGIIWLGCLLGFVFNYFYLGLGIGQMILGALIGGGFFFLQFIISRGQWIGGGDVRLGLMMGVWLGWQGVLAALLFAYIVGAIFSVGMLIAKKKTWISEIPFGTFLSLGTFFAMYWGQQLIRFYLSLLK